MIAPPRIRVLIADEQELVRGALAHLLEAWGHEVVGQARDAAQAVALSRERRPDITLLALRTPAREGIDTLLAIRAVDPGARVVVMSAFDHEEPVAGAFRAGARGYLLKGSSPEVLRRCLDFVHAGERFILPEVAQRLAASAGEPTPTSREIEVLAGVAQGLCNKRIARSLGIEEGTVKAHLKNILNKLNAESRTQAAAIAIRQGLVPV